MRFLALAVTVTALAAVAAPLPLGRAEADARALQGEWVASRKVAGGTVTLTVAGDRMTFRVDGEVATVYEFTLDPNRTPRAMDLQQVETASGFAGKRLLAVYRIKGDELTLAYGRDRPADLNGSKPAEGVYVRKRKEASR
jgi:uncharacterized protein (TIGR03067 family)